jgi:hypothetical protein
MSGVGTELGKLYHHGLQSRLRVAGATTGKESAMIGALKNAKLTAS